MSGPLAKALEDAAGKRKAPETPLARVLAGVLDEASGAFERYGRRSGAQRDASLALLNQASAPGTDPIMGAGQKLLGLAGLITHPLAFFPTGDEWRERLRNSGNDGRMGQAIGGMLGDLPSLIDPHLVAGGAATVAPAIFAGVMAKTADLNKLKQAEKLAELGHSADDILDMTGWFKGADGKWRFEIPDNKAELTKNAKDWHFGSDQIKDVLDHERLSAAYPQLSSYLTRARAGQGGSFDPTNRIIELGADAEHGSQRGTLLHELQHAVQQIEGFSPGTSAAFYQDALRNNLVPEGELVKLDHYTRSQPARRAGQLYQQSAGEVEARNVTNRSRYSDKDRERFPPWRTQSHKPDVQIVLPADYWKGSSKWVAPK